MKRESKKAPKVTVYSPGTQVNQPINMKTSGIETRGNGAATKGTKARGPMA